MSTSQTPNYGLNQWSPEDQFLREEFNADNARTDAALAALAASIGEKAAKADLTALSAAVNVRGNCRIAAGSYTGSGNYGSGSRTSITFPFAPLLVVIQSNSGPYVVMTANNPEAYAHFGNFFARWSVSWSGASVSWYIYHAISSNGSSSGMSSDGQFNDRGTVYRYIALGSAG